MRVPGHALGAPTEGGWAERRARPTREYVRGGLPYRAACPMNAPNRKSTWDTQPAGPPAKKCVSHVKLRRDSLRGTRRFRPRTATGSASRISLGNLAGRDTSTRIPGLPCPQKIENNYQLWTGAYLGEGGASCITFKCAHIGKVTYVMRVPGHALGAPTEGRAGERVPHKYVCGGLPWAACPMNAPNRKLTWDMQPAGPPAKKCMSHVKLKHEILCGTC
ncbi:hypothetical protein BKA93DRAFT_754183 [Sparassis latifolia]